MQGDLETRIGSQPKFRTKYRYFYLFFLNSLLIINEILIYFKVCRPEQYPIIYQILILTFPPQCSHTHVSITSSNINNISWGKREEKTYTRPNILQIKDPRPNYSVYRKTNHQPIWLKLWRRSPDFDKYSSNRKPSTACNRNMIGS